MDSSTLPPPVYVPFPDDGSGFDTDVVVVGLGPAGGTATLALATYGAQPVTPEQNSAIYARVAPIVAGLAQRMNIPMPRLWFIADNSPNAFATGRNPNHASVAFTAGILESMNDAEIEGVVAHELGHVLHRDILISSVAATIATAITFVARMGFFFGGSRDDEEDCRPMQCFRNQAVIAAWCALHVFIRHIRHRPIPYPPSPPITLGSPSIANLISIKRRFAGRSDKDAARPLPRLPGWPWHCLTEFFDEG